MIRTVVCQKEGCSGNSFYIETNEDKLQIICKVCGNRYEFHINYDDYVLISTCSKCNNETFKIFRDMEKGNVYAKCTKCGSPPEKIYIDSDGVQVSYETRLLHDIREIMKQVDQKVLNLELKIEMMEHGQEILEESLAYINKYIIQKD